MKFKSHLWQNELDFLPFKKINIFVGRYFNETSELIDHFTSEKLGIGHMFLGSKWYYEDVPKNLLYVFRNYPIFAHVNSWDVIQQIPKVIDNMGLKDDFQLIRIGTSARASDKGDTIATYLPWSIVNTMVESNWETIT